MKTILPIYIEGNKLKIKYTINLLAVKIGGKVKYYSPSFHNTVNYN